MVLPLQMALYKEKLQAVLRTVRTDCQQADLSAARAQLDMLRRGCCHPQVLDRTLALHSGGASSTGAEAGARSVHIGVARPLDEVMVAKVEHTRLRCEEVQRELLFHLFAAAGATLLQAQCAQLLCNLHSQSQSQQRSATRSAQLLRSAFISFLPAALRGDGGEIASSVSVDQGPMRAIYLTGEDEDEGEGEGEDADAYHGGNHQHPGHGAPAGVGESARAGKSGSNSIAGLAARGARSVVDIHRSAGHPEQLAAQYLRCKALQLYLFAWRVFEANRRSTRTIALTRLQRGGSHGLEVLCDAGSISPHISCLRLRWVIPATWQSVHHPLSSTISEQQSKDGKDDEQEDLEWVAIPPGESQQTITQLLLQSAGEERAASTPIPVAQLLQLGNTGIGNSTEKKSTVGSLEVTEVATIASATTTATPTSTAIAAYGKGLGAQIQFGSGRKLTALGLHDGFEQLVGDVHCGNYGGEQPHAALDSATYSARQYRYILVLLPAEVSLRAPAGGGGGGGGGNEDVFMEVRRACLPNPLQRDPTEKSADPSNSSNASNTIESTTTSAQMVTLNTTQQQRSKKWEISVVSVHPSCLLLRWAPSARDPQLMEVAVRSLFLPALVYCATHAPEQTHESSAKIPPRPALQISQLCLPGLGPAVSHVQVCLKAELHDAEFDVDSLQVIY